MARKYKLITRQSTIDGAIDDAKSEVESLREEMTGWRDNLEDKLSGTEKYQQVSDCCDALDTLYDTLGGIDLSSLPDGISDTAITYTESHPYGRKPQPRWMRLSNAEAAFTAAQSAIEAARDEQTTAECSCDNPPEDQTSHSDEHELDCGLYVEDEADAPEEVDFDGLLTEMEQADWGIDFPGMY